MGRHEKTGRAKKAKGGSKVQDINADGGTTSGEKHKCASKLARDALRDYISAASTPQSELSTAAAGEKRGSSNAGAQSYNEYQTPGSQGNDESDVQFLSHKSPGFPEIGGVLKSNTKAMDDVVLQLALEQQQAKMQDEEQKIRLLQLLGHLPNSELLNIQAAALRSTVEAQGRGAQEQAELKQTQERQELMSAYNRHQANKAQASKDAASTQAQKNETALSNRGGGKDLSNALEAMQRMQGGGPPVEDMFFQLMNQRSLPLERVMQMVKQREAQAKNTPQAFALHSPSLARAHWNPSASPGGKGGADRYGGISVPPAEYNKELLRQFHAFSSKAPPSHPLQHPRLLSTVHAVHPPNIASDGFARNLGGGGHAAATPTSYDLVPETPRNDELIQRAKYLVHLSQADMSTWRTTRRRFRDEDEEIEEENESLSEAKPRSRKKKPKSAI